MICPSQSIVWLCITSRFVTPFAYHVDMPRVFVNSAKECLICPNNPVVWYRIASWIITPFTHYVDVFGVFVNSAKDSFVCPRQSVYRSCNTPKFITPFALLHVDVFWMSVNSAIERLLGAN